MKFVKVSKKKKKRGKCKSGKGYPRRHSGSSGSQTLTEVISQQTALHPNADSNSEMMNPKMMRVSFINKIPCKLKSRREERWKD